MQTAQRFTNYTDEDFVCNWDGKPWKLKAGETIMLESHLAAHFAKHLIIRELNEEDIQTNSKVEVDKRIALCLGTELIEAESPEKLASKVMNAGEDKTKEVVDLKDMTRPQLEEVAKVEGIENIAEYKNVTLLREAIMKKQEATPETTEDKKDGEFEDLTNE